MSVRVRWSPAGEAGVVVVALAGDLDLDGEEQVVAEVQRVLRDETPIALLDLAEVDFIDSSGVRALLRLNRAHGDRVRLGPISGSVRRVLDIAGVTELFEDPRRTGAGGHGPGDHGSEGGR